jgi:phage gpG-like protein
MEYTRVEELLERLKKNLQGPNTVMPKIAEDFRETEASIFRTEGSFQGRTKWPALSQNYEDWKEAMYPGMKILELEGPLKNSLISKGTNYVERMGTHILEIGTRDPKAFYHQQGTRKMPPRPPVSVNDKQKNRWIKIIVKELLEVK